MLNWYAVHTHVHAESVAARHLERQEFSVYLPKHLKRRSHARRVETIQAPLFPRYLFVQIDTERSRWRAISSTVGVSHLVSFGGEPAPVPFGVVEEIRACEDDRGVVDLHRRRPFQPGEKVRLLDGPLRDTIGLFDCADDAMRVTILLDLLGRQVRVRMPTSAIAAVA
jgi:transcriptional antiterminator RfaH